jgi:xanthine/uracil permease
MTIPRRAPTPLVHVYLVLMIGLADLRTRAVNQRQERGALTTEQAIITAALIGLAVLVVAAITAAVNNKLPLIR